MRRSLFLLALPLAPALGLVATASVADPPHDVSVVRDPTPLTEKTQWVFDLRWERGDVYFLGARKIEMPQPMTTPRVMGRFALELTDHGHLIERARFDFPGMAVPDEDGGVRMIAGLKTRIGVFFPATSRGDKLELVDRSTGQRWSLPWPPVLPDGGPG
ncbi:MAG TPA: hypothetical protein VGH28_19075 [Polyangiaceae bacterium]